MIVAGIPVRYIHTFNCIAVTEDVEACVRFGTELCRELKKEIIENDYSLTVNSYIEHLTQKEEIDIWANTYSLIASSIHNIVRNTEFIICIDECIDYL